MFLPTTRDTRPSRTRTMLRSAIRADTEAWMSLRAAHSPDADPRELRAEIERWFWSGDRDTQCIVAEEDGQLLGFIELSVRSYAEGCETTRIGYVQGWYVTPGAHRRRVRRTLMRAGEAWAVQRGCREFASNAEATDTPSQSDHVACGFTEVRRIVCFRKAIRQTSKRANG